MLDLRAHIVSRGGECHFETIQLPSGRARCRVTVKLPIPNMEAVFIEAIHCSSSKLEAESALLNAFHKAQYLLDLLLVNISFGQPTFGKI